MKGYFLSSTGWGGQVRVSSLSTGCRTPVVFGCLNGGCSEDRAKLLFNSMVKG